MVDVHLGSFSYANKEKVAPHTQFEAWDVPGVRAFFSVRTPLTNDHLGFANPGLMRDVHHHVRYWDSDIWSYDNGRGARGGGRGDEECGSGKCLRRISYKS